MGIACDSNYNKNPMVQIHDHKHTNDSKHGNAAINSDYDSDYDSDMTEPFPDDSEDEIDERLPYDYPINTPLIHAPNKTTYAIIRDVTLVALLVYVGSLMIATNILM
jgi:hypothetical protein